MKPVKEQPHPLLDKIMKEMGNKLCEACSVPNWKIYHTPGNPCPKGSDMNSRSTS